MSFQRLPAEHRGRIAYCASQIIRRRTLEMWELWLRIFSVSGGIGIVAELVNVGFEPVSFVVMLSLFAVLVGGRFWCEQQGSKCFLAIYDEQRELEKELGLEFSHDGKKVHLVKANAFGSAERSPGLDPFEAEAYE